MGNFSLRLFLRVAARNREVYLLKIITLAIAIASATVVILFSLNEFGYDRFHKDAHAVFRILEKNVSEKHLGNRTTSKIPVDLFERLRTELSDSAVLSQVMIMKGMSATGDGVVLSDMKIHAADPQIAGIFSFDVVDGSLEDFGAEWETALVSASMARALFGNPLATGKKLTIFSGDDTVQFSVAAVYDDFPKNSHEDFNIFIPFKPRWVDSLRFDSHRSGIYGRVVHSDIAPIATRVSALGDIDDLVYQVEPLPSIYFGPRISGEDSRHGDSYSILILVCITTLILLLAVISYVNLTTLTLPHRSKELAVKKLAGTTQAELFLTFSKESLLIVLLSFFCGVLILFATSDWINTLLAIDVTSLLIDGDTSLFIVLAAVLFTLTLAPLILTLKFIRASPNRLLSTEKITFPRLKQIIAVLQLGISIFLIMSSVVIKRQINYSLLKEPGRNHDQVVYLDFPSDLTSEGLFAMRSGWQKYHPNIVDVIATSQLPDRISSKEIGSPFYFVLVDQYFPNFYNLNILDGNWFKPNAADSSFVVNEHGLKYAGSREASNLIGVIEDISAEFNLAQKPVKFKLTSHFNYNYLCIRILEVDIRRTIGYLTSYFNGAQIHFLNKRFEDWLTYQDRLNTLSGFLAIISAILSCCAIYGLSVSLVRDKLKQIAVHKICGASGISISILLARQFLSSLFLALIIFGPVTYIFLSELLRNFVFATRFEWLDPVFPLVYCAITVFVLCGFQALNLRRRDLTAALKE